MASENYQVNLTAAYKSPDNESFTITKVLPAMQSASVEDKTTYLGAVRKAVTETQEQINKELTARMEEEKIRGATSGLATKLGADEDKEEENYGEEAQYED
ncbi:hypothetical protein QQS21_001099 [Conoideocrella luteorostrata]|uniref:EKC/KEOPS complex subunit GON7 n=1 Tax=Conoideocrella luteorostrata TaxID=1105319 RepID=A0AAJ0CXK0_9HYPO|nr:hypothetical protein QQS21_001099 [Conoideocrella luteorostrata]